MIKEKKLLQIEKYSYKVLKLDFCRYEKQVLITYEFENMDKGRLSWLFAGTTKFIKLSLTILLTSYLRKSTFKKLSMDQKLKVNFQSMSFMYIFSLINLSKKIYFMMQC